MPLGPKDYSKAFPLAHRANPSGEGRGYVSDEPKPLKTAKLYRDRIVEKAKFLDNLWRLGTTDPYGVAPLDYTKATFDMMLMGTPGGGTGVANIGRRDAIKMLARTGANEARNAATRRRTYIKGPGLEEIKDPGLREEYARLIHKRFMNNVKASIEEVRKLPQSELDRIEGIYWGPEKASNPGRMGVYRPVEKKVKLTEHLGKRLSHYEQLVRETLLHEMTHARQWAPDPKVGEMILAKAIRNASEGRPYTYQPIEQLARRTARHQLNIDSYREEMGQAPQKFGETYRKQLKYYIDDAKQTQATPVLASEDDLPTGNVYAQLQKEARKALTAVNAYRRLKVEIPKWQKATKQAGALSKKIYQRGNPKSERHAKLFERASKTTGKLIRGLEKRQKQFRRLERHLGLDR